MIERDDLLDQVVLRVSVATAPRTGSRDGTWDQAEVIDARAKPYGIVITATETDAKAKGVKVRINLSFAALAPLVELLRFESLPRADEQREP